MRRRRHELQRVALVVERRLVERGVDERARVIPRLATVPSTGLRFECTLNTFMNTLIFSASRSRYGSRALPIRTTRPSAGDSTAFGCAGTLRGGSRKNCSDEDEHDPRDDASSHHDAQRQRDGDDQRDGEKRPAFAGDDRMRDSGGRHRAAHSSDAPPRTVDRVLLRNRIVDVLLLLRAAPCFTMSSTPRARSSALRGVTVAACSASDRAGRGRTLRLRRARRRRPYCFSAVLREQRDDDERQQDDDEPDPAALAMPQCHR